MMPVELMATTTFGLEAVVKRELQSLGYHDLTVSDGKISFLAEMEAIPRTNLWLRSADRVLLKVGEFKALTFDELFEKTKALPWNRWIPPGGKFPVTGKSVKSRLFSVSDCQAIVKKAVVESLKDHYSLDWFPETGPELAIQVSLLQDVATLTLDTSGEGLHKRGYRREAGEAPLKETLAAALVQLSYWRKNRLLMDPFCGSGTIPIEAALMGRNIAPGLNRSFASEEWPAVDKSLWKQARVEAFRAIDTGTDITILASDIDAGTIEKARSNALEAGVDDCIDFQVKPVGKVALDREYGVVITNPPYGQRIGSRKEVHKIYREMDRVFHDPTWSIYVLTADEDFEKAYGTKAHRKRKLYNGNIKVDYYQFYGKRPPREEK